MRPAANPGRLTTHRHRASQPSTSVATASTCRLQSRCRHAITLLALTLPLLRLELQLFFDPSLQAKSHARQHMPLRAHTSHEPWPSRADAAPEFVAGAIDLPPCLPRACDEPEKLKFPESRCESGPDFWFHFERDGSRMRQSRISNHRLFSVAPCASTA